MEHIRTYPCLYDKSKMSHKGGDVNRNTWDKIAEKLDVMQKRFIHCRYYKLAVHLQW